MRAIARATTRIEELGAMLDGQMLDELRPEERLRHLRHATGQITRTANDAIQAYRRVSAALREEADRPGADLEEIERATQALAEGRSRMLAALEVASQRYPWAEPWRPTADGEPDGERPGG